MSQVAEARVIRKAVTVGAPAERAFAVFTTEMGSWWPLGRHSVGLDDAVMVTVEEHAGGRVYETLADGSESDWGLISVWEPPHRLVFSWHPGRDAATAQEVDVRFTPEGGGTRIELEHRGWEKLGERAGEIASGYAAGWDVVLGAYVEAAAG
jgi:uncharacterized protein YndB with AHSA1/START domain